MKRLVRPPVGVDSDIERIREALARMGYEADAATIAEAYAEYSNDLDSSWLALQAGDYYAGEAARELIGGGHLVEEGSDG